MKLKILKTVLSISRLHRNSKIPFDVLQSEFFSVTKTEDELSIVHPSGITLDSEKTESGWSGIQVVGVLDFSQTGILSSLSLSLSHSKIGIFVVSTFDMDYILLKTDKLPAAVECLEAAGHQFLS